MSFRWPRALLGQTFEQPRRAAQVQAVGVALDHDLERRPQLGQKGALLRAELGAREGGVDHSRADLLAGQALVQVDAGEVGEPFVDGALDAHDALGHVPGRW